MMLAEWNDSYSVGIAIIDDQHKILFGLINDLQSSIHKSQKRENLGDVLERLVEYTKLHFETEESLMRDHKFPETQEHVKEHNSMSLKLLKFKERFDHGTEDLTLELLMELIDWLHSHLGETDSKLKDFMNDRGVY